MGVVSCNIDSATADMSKDGYTSYVVTYRVVTDDRTTGPNTVLRYGGIPGPSSLYSCYGENNGGAAFQGKSAKYQDKEGSGIVWLVECRFSDDPGQAQKKDDPEQPPGSPLDEPPKISLTTTKTRQAVLYDLDGKMVASSAGEPYDPVQEIDRTNYILRIVRNVESVNVPLNASYRDAVNSDFFFGLQPRCVKVEVPGAVETLYFAGRKYFQETWEFAINTDTWDVTLYDYGMLKIVGEGANRKFVNITDGHGNPLAAPRFLQGNGKVNPIGDPPITLAPFHFYEKMNFAALNLPQSL